jgi:cytochrome c oxidase cbb3-type subunit 3
LRARIFAVVGSVCLAASVAPIYGQAPATNTQTNNAPGTQNAPPPPGGTQESRQPPAARRGFGGAGAGYEVVPPDVLERGQKLYQANCSFCHGANAKGGESGPNLVRSLVVLHDEHGNQIGQVVLNGRPDKGMPKFPFTSQQVSDIAAFLHDQVRAAALRGTYQILNIVTGNPKQGEAYFNGPGGCSGCHSVTGDLAHIGSKLDPVDLQQHIVMPRQGRPGGMAHVSPKEAIHVTVTTPSGQTMSGVLDHIDDFNVAFTDSNGEYHSLPRHGNTPEVKLTDPMNAHMALLRKYTDSDIHNLTAYLVTLK